MKQEHQTARALRLNELNRANSDYRVLWRTKYASLYLPVIQYISFAHSTFHKRGDHASFHLNTLRHASNLRAKELGLPNFGYN